MRKILLGAASAVALVAGTAFAQTQGTDQPMAPETEAPAASTTAPMSDTDTAPADTAAGESTPDATAPDAAMDEPTAAEATTAPATTAPTAGAGTEVSADDMIGRTVYGEEDQEIGEVKDVILDPDTKQINRLVVGTGGFLGIGEKTVAIDMTQVEIRPEQGIYVSGLRQEDVQGMEEYNPDDSTASLDEPAPATTGTGAPTGGMASPSAPPPATAPAGQ